MALFALCCFIVPLFAPAPLTGLAAFALWVKGWHEAGRFAAMAAAALAVASVVAVLSSVLLASSGPILALAAALVLAGNALACEAAYRAGEQDNHAGATYLLGLVLTWVPALFGSCALGLLDLGARDRIEVAADGSFVHLSELLQLFPAMLGLLGLLWACLGGPLLLGLAAVRTAPVGGYDAVDGW